jgi:hypothetical protein
LMPPRPQGDDVMVFGRVVRKTVDFLFQPAIVNFIQWPHRLLIALYLVVSDSPVTGDSSQSISGRSSYSCSARYLVLDEATELESYEFDDYEEFLQDDDFRQHLISEVEVRPGPFVFGNVDDLFLGVVNDSGDVLWSAEAAELLGENSISATFNP